MELIIHNSSCVKNNLLCLGLSSIVKIIDNPHDLLDQLLKISVSEFSDLKNVFRDFAKQDAPLFKGQCLVTMTTVLLRAFEMMVSFLVDHLPLCSTECTAWIATQIISMMVQHPDLQNSAQVLTPLVLHFSATYSTLNAYIVLLLEKELGSLIFQEKDKSQLLHHLILNSCHPSISPSIRLLYLDWLNNYLIREPEKKADIHNVAYLLPGSFDGSETLLRKLGLLSSILKNKEGSCRVLLHSLTILQKQLKCGSSIKLKSALIKILYKFLYDHGSEVATDIPSTATLATFHYVLDVFLVAIEQDMSICQPKAILNYMIKYVVCEEVCGLLSWSLGHKILSLCNRLMSNYDTIEFFYELCEVLKMFKSNCEDVDLLDRAHIYHSLLVSLSNKKLKQILVPPKQSLNSIMSNENTFHSTSSVCRLDKPVLQLTKESSSHLSKEKIIVETKQDIPEDILKLYTRHLSFVAQKPLILKGRLDTTSKVVSNMETFQEPIMIGHYEKKGNEKPCVVDIECFLYKPYPAVIQVCAEFSIHHMYYICNLEPLSVELSDFFQPLPIHDDFICSPVLWRKSLFNCLWKHLEERSETVNNAVFTSVYVLHEPREDIMNKINAKLHNYIVEEFPEDKDIFLNSDCPVRVLQNCIHDLLTQSESINNLSSISNTFEVDLCDENGQLKNLSSLEPWANGYESGIFIFRATYTVVILEHWEQETEERI
ncbi:hypothetical protein C0J52_03746 [Blattella germanica]|nr:hypothetical protein C0J52_03746 [Blattella germanica]